jgi:pimeloyl-ACP methyl ester carboxylesterase
VSLVQVRGHEVHVRDFGRGPHTVVFVHGMVMDNMASWFFTLANPVSKSARVILYDLRGHGRSERTESGYTIPGLIADLDGLLDALEVRERVVLVGNSFGGLLALSYAIAHPERVEGLVLVDGNMHDDQWNDEVRQRFSISGDDVEAAVAEIKRYSFRYAGLDSPRKRNQLGRSAWRLVHRTDFVEEVTSSPAFTAEELRSVSCPVLALYGADSELAERARRMIEQLPDCEAVWFEGYTHLLLWEASEEVRRRVSEWLDGLESSVDEGRAGG